ncbi:hypothetical protein ACH42_09740 [Endozoicomonas sp. (ex Bugula neritina AB1)]|nr:hypothetical protein ACH42_09740 [Endozoicomonas sp. (ex Bugula neritina AB1)]
MKETVNDRINAVLQKAMVKKYQFAEKVGVSKTFMSDVSLGKQRPSGTMLIGIAEKFPDIDMNWVLTGDGTITKREDSYGAIELEDLAVVVRTVEEALKKANINPAPEKRAKLITAAYDLYMHSDKPENTTPILKLIYNAANQG